MSQHNAKIQWNRNGQNFTYKEYPRDHVWTFEGGTTVAASASPVYLGTPGNVDPEEAFVASLSACHMLTLLALAAERRFVIDSYEDEAYGTLEKNEDGRLAMTRIVLRPRIEFSGDVVPSPEDIATLHDQAHRYCFIANSVNSEVVVD